MKVLCAEVFSDTKSLSVFTTRNKIKKNDIQNIFINAGQLFLFYWFDPKKKFIPKSE